ncbi:DXD sugar-binding motif glycosyltransferase [Vibrio phage 150E35-1]|nr:DXD sugar-binding motif glycosyltransferase [Vibrio phage 150E35-1]
MTKILHMVWVGATPHEIALKCIRRNMKVALQSQWLFMFHTNIDPSELPDDLAKYAVDVSEYVNSITPKYKWCYKRGGEYNYSHIADAIRIKALLEHGGMYQDADNYVLVDDMDFVLGEWSDKVQFQGEGNGYLKLNNCYMYAPHAYHPVMQTSYDELDKLGDRQFWGICGPSMFTRLFPADTREELGIVARNNDTCALSPGAIGGLKRKTPDGEKFTIDLSYFQTAGYKVISFFDSINEGKMRIINEL